MRKIVSILLVILPSLGAAAGATDLTTPDSLAAKLSELMGRKASHVSEANTCVFQSISCGQGINGSLDPGDCSLGAGFPVEDFFQFNGTVGQVVVATLTSFDFPPFLELLDPASNNAQFIGATIAPRVQIQFTLNSSGTWTWGVTNNGGGSFQTGNYSLGFECPSSSAACTADDSTLCLNNGRFKVKATFDAGGGKSGQAHVVSLTGDTGYLWFFNSSNVEAVVKVLDACGLGGHYWVFAGGLTNVNTVMTVTDTQTQATKTYTNPPNTTFKPIQDTSAFATCP